MAYGDMQSACAWETATLPLLYFHISKTQHFSFKVNFYVVRRRQRLPAERDINRKSHQL